MSLDFLKNKTHNMNNLMQNMNKKYFISLVLFSVLGFAQTSESKSKTMEFYVSPNIQIGYNLNNSVKNKQYQNDEYYQHYVRPYLPNDFTYGIGVVGGYQLLPFFGIGTGIKYNYISDNFHLLNWVVQPKFFIGKDEQKFTIELEYGKQFNHSNISNTKYFGGKIGYQDSFSKNLNQEFGLFLYNGNYTFSNTKFIGISYNITFFSNRNYTVYGEN